MEQEETTYIISGVPNRPDLEGMELTGPELDDFINDEEVFNIIGGHVVEKTQPHKNWDESISGLKETGENVQNMMEEAVVARDLGPSGWGIKGKNKIIPLTPTELKRTLNYAHEKGMDKLINSGRLLTTLGPTGELVPATKEDVEDYPYLRPELPQTHLEISSSEAEPEQFKFPSFNDMADWMVRPGGFLVSSQEKFINDTERNPYKKMWQDKKDDGADENSEEMKNLERQATIYGMEALKNFDEALKQYNENEQPAALHWLGENLDAFDLATAPVGVGLAPVKALAKMGPIARLGAETAIQAGLEGAHSGIEGEDVGFGMTGGAASTLAPAGVGYLLRGVGKGIGKVAGKKATTPKFTNKEINEQAFMYRDGASPEMDRRIVREITYPSNRPMFTTKEINADIDARIPENIQRGLQLDKTTKIGPITLSNMESPYPEIVRLGDRRITHTSLDGPRDTYPTEWHRVGPEDFELKESWITDDLRTTIADMYPELSAKGVKRGDLDSFVVGKDGVSSVEKRILDELPDVDEVTLSDLIKAINRFKPNDEYELLLKHRLLNKLGTTEIRFNRGPTKYELGFESKHTPAPYIPDWEKLVEPRSGWWDLVGARGSLYPLIKRSATQFGRDAAREEFDEKFKW